MSLYNKRGVSAQKEEVHKAVEHLDQGLYPNAFCKLYPDYLGGDADWVNVTHADGAGTKSILAYLYWKETGNASVWKGIAQDAIVMNLDDLLCVGIYDNILFSSTVDRNKTLIPGEVLEQVINGSAELFAQLKEYGVNIHYLGGETADVGDVVRTIAVNGTMTARWPKSKVISNDKIKAGDVIVGLAGFGQADYETFYNSGLGSNGLTSARHDVLEKYYAHHFPETFESKLSDDVVYIGKHRLADEVQLPNGETSLIGRLLLSPTRTFAPVLKEILQNHFDAVHGLIHCSGGGQTKCMKYLPGPMKIVKDNLFTPPIIFDLIQEASGADAREMYQVFNMGTRLEIYTNEKDADTLINISKSFGVDAQVIGRVEASEKKELLIKLKDEELTF
ncbi:phosphoribosylformylglycinamidine cyclo-ligase [Lacibacter luteus]|uniref:Phosphoribosylformylglycinamidine cyclo-ligase n=1 Tax=Lacibacter luteus TaxID=2508719 RepID=A0A4Q1CGA6_9BACT|nr:AIR synthase related protein [Lacibacter luteus]RXK58810.1 phosphoribosylformylglycinamidine cyclo-ligase [Lacibacter luteus]